MSADEDERAELLVRELLADPSMWDEPDPSLEDRVVAAVMAEAAQPAAQLDRHHGRNRNHRRLTERRLVRYGVVAAAAAAVVGVAVTAETIRGGSSAPSMTAALTAYAPTADASGSASFTRTSAGWRVALRTSGLPRLDNGRFYEAWMKNEAGVLVAIGTFNQGPKVTLWSGVSPTQFATITVTAQEANGNPASSGQRVLTGNIEPR